MGDIEVSVLCTVYNHEKFLRRCLEGFVTQQTNFKYEILINDDKSTDSSRDIIEEYKEKYPDLIIPIYQKENQYQKGVKISTEILAPISKGKYIAICEGDDYWCDDKKLQRQYDYMENNKNCSLCIHNTLKNNLLSPNDNKNFFNWDDIHKLNDEEVFLGWNAHTSSYFIRRETFMLICKLPKYWFGDLQILTFCYSIGEVVALPQVMSVYNYNNTQGVTYQLRISNLLEFVEKQSQIIKYFEEFNENTNKKYEKAIRKRINKESFDIMLKQEMLVLTSSKNKSELINSAKKINSHIYFEELLKQQSIFQRLKSLFKFKGYFLYPVWKFAWNIFSNNKGC